MGKYQPMPLSFSNCPEEEEVVPSSQDFCSSQDINLKLRGGGDLDDDLLRPCSPASSRSKAATLLRTCSTRKTSSRKAESLLRTCSTRKTSSPRSAEKSKVIKSITKAKFWCCPYCQDKIQIEENGKRLHDVSDIISKHLRKRHHAVWVQACQDNLAKGKRGSGLGLRQLCCNVEFIHIPQKDWVKKALFVCPYCRLAMPNITEAAGILNQKERYLVKRSKLHLLKICTSKQARGKTIQQCRKDALKKFRYFFAKRTFGLSQKRGINYRRNIAIQHGHDPVEVPLSYGRWFARNADIRSVSKTSIQQRNVLERFVDIFMKFCQAPPSGVKLSNREKLMRHWIAWDLARTISIRSWIPEHGRSQAWQKGQAKTAKLESHGPSPPGFEVEWAKMLNSKHKAQMIMRGSLSFRAFFSLLFQPQRCKPLASQREMENWLWEIGASMSVD